MSSRLQSTPADGCHMPAIGLARGRSPLPHRAPYGRLVTSTDPEDEPMATTTRMSGSTAPTDDDLATTAKGIASDVADRAAAAAARLPDAAHATGGQLGR